MLTLLFSAIRIYRNFKTKASPKIHTISDAYSGTDLNEVLENEFSDSEISE
jgi:DNA-binding phage protein